MHRLIGMDELGQSCCSTNIEIKHFLKEDSIKVFPSRVIKSLHGQKNFDIKIIWLNLYGMIFHEQHSYGYGFPSQPPATSASMVVPECFLALMVMLLVLENHSNTSALDFTVYCNLA